MTATALCIGVIGVGFGTKVHVSEFQPEGVEALRQFYEAANE